MFFPPTERLGAFSAGSTSLLRSAAVPARQQSRGEEIANSVSHGLALLAAVAVIPLLTRRMITPVVPKLSVPPYSQ
jgi:predicted membrane channel-forming protein YqfA (hemolysin III family)